MPCGLELHRIDEVLISVGPPLVALKVAAVWLSVVPGPHSAEVEDIFVVVGLYHLAASIADRRAAVGQLLQSDREPAQVSVTFGLVREQTGRGKAWQDRNKTMKSKDKHKDKSQGQRQGQEHGQ